MERAKITFLGTGGGRFVIITQVRATGGLVLEMDGEMLHIDPGPGALVRAKQYGVNLRKLTGILVSHNHPDHYADAEVAIEPMTAGGKNKKGVIIGSDYVINGGNGYHAVFSKYHLDRVKEYRALKPGDKTNIGRIKITATPTKHKEVRGIGFVFRGSRKIGYTSDGEYIKEQEQYFQDCDCLILNCLRPRNENWPEHMNAEQAGQLIEKTKPRLAVLQHLGMKMLKGVCFKEAAWIQKQTGIKTIAAKDGMKLEIK